jgi:transcriptional regulator with XRE-family HTH domain
MYTVFLVYKSNILPLFCFFNTAILMGFQMVDEIVERLKTSRSTLGFTQKQIGEAIGVTLRTWQDYEAGKSIPGGNALAGLARLGVDINWLLIGEKKREAVKIFASTYEAEDYLLNILPHLSKAIELHYADDRSKTRVSYLVRFKNGELQLLVTPMCHDRGARIEEVEKIRHGISVYIQSPLLYASVSEGQLLALERNPDVKVMEELFGQVKVIMSRRQEVATYMRWLNSADVLSSQYEVLQEGGASGPIEEFLFEKRKTGQDTGWVSVAFADCFPEFKEWLKERQERSK